MGTGQIQERCGGCIPPPAIFKHIFGEYSFFIIFDNNKPYALRTHNRNRTKCIIFSETLRCRGKQLNKNCLKIVQKVLKCSVGETRVDIQMTRTRLETIGGGRGGPGGGGSN